SDCHAKELAAMRSSHVVKVLLGATSLSAAFFAAGEARAQAPYWKEFHLGRPATGCSHSPGLSMSAGRLVNYGTATESLSCSLPSEGERLGGLVYAANFVKVGLPAANCWIIEE